MFDILFNGALWSFACQLDVCCSHHSNASRSNLSLSTETKLFALPQGLKVCYVYAGVHARAVSVCLHFFFPARQLHASSVWRSGYSTASSRRCHTRTGHGSHAQNCLNRSQTSTHLLWRQIGGLQKVDFTGRANSFQWDSPRLHKQSSTVSFRSLKDLWINEIWL